MNKKIIGIVLFSLVLMTLASSVDATPTPPKEQNVAGDTYQDQILAKTQTMLVFRNRTRIRINSSVNIDINIDCDAMEIGDQTFSLDICDADCDMEMVMVCKRDEVQLGLQAGATIRNRNRNQHRLHTKFAVKLEADGTLEARLGLAMSEQEAERKEWAYYDESTQEWVPVESSYEDGELVTVTDHFSVWSIVETTSTIGLPVFIVSGIAAVAIIASLLYAKRRVTLA